MVLAVAASIFAVSACKNSTKAAEGEATEATECACTECTDTCTVCTECTECNKTVEEAVEGAAEQVKGE